MFKAYTEFQKLKKVMVGRALPSELVTRSIVGNKLTPTTKRLLTYLLDETEEDYQNLINICQKFGSEVVRPQYTDKDYMLHYLMNPRDEMIVLDRFLILTIGGGNFTKPLSEDVNHIKRSKSLAGLMPPSIVRLGKDIILDDQPDQHSNTKHSAEALKKWLQPIGYKVHFTQTHNFQFKGRISHSDSCFSIQKPGVILTSEDARSYTETFFKGWDAFQVTYPQDKVKNWIRFKDDTKAYLFEDNKYIDPAWNKLLTTWLSDWVGYAKETLFDVNVLSLDENHVIVSNYNKEVFNFFKKHKIEPIISPWRHRYFWDGGIHCITCDLEREGNCEQYL